jgi:uncharacterized protein YrrD
MTAGQIHGLPVVTVRGGEDIAEVRDVIYDPAAGSLVGLTLNQRGFLSGRRKEMITSSSIHAIGRDAVMVMDESALMLPSESAEVTDVDGSRNVLGNEVLTDAGVALGKVEDLIVVVGTGGEVVGYQIAKAGGGTAFIPLPAQLAISGTALVVPAVTDEFVKDDLVGLAAAVDEFRARLGMT